MRQIDSGTGVGIQHGERQSSVNGVTMSSGADIQKAGPTTGGVRALRTPRPPRLLRDLNTWVDEVFGVY